MKTKHTIHRVIPYTRKDLAWTAWTVSDIKKRVALIAGHVQREYTEIKKIPMGVRTFANTVRAIEAAAYPHADDMNRLAILMEASPKKKIRDAAKNALTELEKRLIDIERDPEMYRAFKEYAQKRERLSAPDDAKLMNDMKIAYTRMGFDLSATKQARMKRILKELAKLSADFSNNINVYRDHILVTREDLDGLPENYIQGLKKKNGKFIVSLDYPEIIPFLAHARNAAKREELVRKNLRKGGVKNMTLAKKILALRHEYARLLGYRNHVDYKLAVRMAHSEKNIRAFISGLIRDITPLVRRDTDMLLVAKEKETGRQDVLRSHDVSYYIEQTKKAMFAIDSEKIREYFPLEKVLSGTFIIYQKLFGVSFTEIRGFPLWHRDVRMFSVSERGSVVGYFVLDLFTREGKYPHACAASLVKGKENADGTYTAPSTVMLANFPRPHGATPTLLSHAEAETLFHEFGHVMHGVLTKARYRSQSGTATKRDFVEAPSQMFEYWVWNAKTIKLLSGHYKTGKPLPPQMLKNMLDAKKHMQGYTAMRQLTFALFDLTIHAGALKKDPARLYVELVRKFQRVRVPNDALFLSGFGHFVGYDAGYYSYLWSKVYGDDMFTRFQKEGILNAKIGRDYRVWILEKGSSREEMELVKGFLGRAPNTKAFLKELGL